jgi:hypothetical protein
MGKYYFRTTDEDDERYSLEYWKDYMKKNDLKKIEVFEALVVRGIEFFYCKNVCEISSKPPEGNPCGFMCDFYTPRNGKNGICKNHGNLYEAGKKIIIKL